MEREQLDRLLAEYATGGLSEEDRKKLFAAALQDQALFDQLMEEDALREVIELPGARDRLIDALQEESVPVLMPASVRAPAPMPAPVRRQPAWYAWAAGIGVVFVSGAISYVLLDPGASEKVAQVMPQSQRDVKPFVAPPERPVSRAPEKVVVEAPPPLMAEARKAEPLPAVNIPLPAAPPPMAEQPAKDANMPVAKSRADAVTVASEAAQVKTATGPTGNALTATNVPAPSRQVARAEVAERQGRDKASAAPATVAGGRVPGVVGQAGGAGAAAPVTLADSRVREKTVAAKESVAPPASADMAAPQAPVSAWRRSGDGVWVRMAPGESVGRDETIVIRYTPVRNGVVTLADGNGPTLVRRDARGGEELELAVPRATLAGSQRGEVSLTVTSGASTSKIVLRIR